MARITYLHQHFRMPAEGGGTRSYEFAKRLAAAGHEVHMVAARPVSDASDATWSLKQMDGFTVHYASVPYSNHMSFSRRMRSFLHFAYMASTKSMSLPTDIIFATSTPLTIAIPAAFAKLRHRVPIVFEVRDLWPEVPIAMGALNNPVSRTLARLLERFAYRISSEIVALSPGMAEGVKSNKGAQGKRVTVIPNCSDVTRFGGIASDRDWLRSEYGVPVDGPLLLYGGTLGMANNVSYLVDLLAALHRRDSDLRLLIVGDGVESDAVSQYAKRQQLLGRSIHMLEPVAKELMPRIIACADICCSVFAPIPELYHNSANKMFDALASGKPIAINYPGWQADLLLRTGAGIQLPADDIEAAADILISAVTSPVWLVDAAAASSQLARDEFNLEDQAATLERILSRNARSN